VTACFLCASPDILYEYPTHLNTVIV
jgi:hypothetical protein